MKVSLRLNGTMRSADVAPWTLLVEYLRNVEGLTGTKIGCETSVCGSCTVLVDGAAVKSCTMLVVQAEGSEIHTIEGMTAWDGFTPLADAMVAEHGVQCGFCTPGVVASLVALLKSEPDPDEALAVAALDGNLCRCTGYVGILRAARRAGALGRGESPDPVAGRALAEPVAMTKVAEGGVAGADVEVV